MRIAAEEANAILRGVLEEMKKFNLGDKEKKGIERGNND